MKFQPGNKKIALAHSQPLPTLGETEPAASPARSTFSLQNIRRKGRTFLTSPNFFAFLGALLLAAIYGRVAVFNLGYGVIGGDLDGYENLWNDSWVRMAIFALHRNPLFFTDYLYYPTGISLRFHTLNPLNGIFALPLWPLLGSVASTNLKFLLSMALTVFCAYLLIKDVVRSSLPAFAGAAVFTFANDLLFGNYAYGQAEKLSMWWVPLYLWCLFRSVNRPRWLRYAIGAILCLLAMSLTDWQFILYSVLLTLGYFIFTLFTRRSWQEKGLIFLKLALVGGVWTAIVIFPMLLPMIKEAADNPWLSVSDQAVDRSRTLLGYFDISTNNTNPGYLALIVGLVGLFLWWRKRPERGERENILFWTITALIASAFTLGPRLHVSDSLSTDIPAPYALIYKLPVLSIGRDPERFYMTAMLGFGIILALALREILAWLGEKSKSWNWQAKLSKAASLLVVGVFLAVTLAGFMVRAGDAQAYPPNWPPFYYTLAQDPEKYAIMELPLFTEKGRGEDTYEAYQSIHGKPRLGGRLARDHKLTNPNNFVKNTTMFRDFYRLNNTDAINLFRPTKGPDILATPDYKTWGIPLFNFYNIRYIIFYLDAFEGNPAGLAAAENMVHTVLGQDAKPVYEDKLMRAYKVPQEPLPSNKLFIDMGSDSWYPAETNSTGTYRWANPCANGDAEKAQDQAMCGDEPAKLSVFNLGQANQRVKVNLTTFNYSQPRTVKITLDGYAVQDVDLQPGEAKDLTLEFDLPPGMHTLNLTSPQPPTGTGNASDKRFLSFGVRGVKLFPAS